MPLERTSLSQQVAADLRRRILVGELPAGSLLPPERDLAARYGTNRNTLREAIRNLESLGLVFVRQGTGVRVRDFRAEGELALLPAFVMEGGREAAAGPLVMDVLRIRRVMLGEAAAMAAARATSPDIARLRGCAAALSGPEAEPEEALAGDLAFYRALVDATHSLVVGWAYNSFSRVYESARPLILALWVVPEHHVEALRALVERIAGHDPDAARTALATHLEQGDRLLETMLASR